MSQVDVANAWLANTAPNARLVTDSRQVKPGDVFVAYGPVHAPAALMDASSDGRRFIEDAMRQGACAVLFDNEQFDWPQHWTVPHHGMSHLRQVAGSIANHHYRQPDHQMLVIAVTGTNGKTSCTQWLGNALARSGTPTAVVGTFGVGLFSSTTTPKFEATGYTTPDAIQLQTALLSVSKQGAKAVAIEASSIGLHQQRMAGMHVDIAVFTNLTRDHLDYHGDMAAYESAKLSLFDWPGLQYAVVNLDDPVGVKIVARLRAKAPGVHITTFGLKAPVSEIGTLHLAASAHHSNHAGTHFQLQLHGASGSELLAVSHLIKTQLLGEFNVSNVLAVLGVLLAKKMPLAEAIRAVEALQPVPGRMQQIGASDQPLVIIDYAHTPDALEKTLASLRHLALERQGALWCVFGCGGDRDPGKRAQMGATSQRADHVIITNDNPRSESPAAIIDDIMKGVDLTSDQPVPQVIEDRASAILWALRHASKTDVVLLAGKGHENTQEINGRKLQFLDADHAALALAARATMKGAA